MVVHNQEGVFPIEYLMGMRRIAKCLIFYVGAAQDGIFRQQCCVVLVFHIIYIWVGFVKRTVVNGLAPIIVFLHADYVGFALEQVGDELSVDLSLVVAYVETHQT